MGNKRARFMPAGWAVLSRHAVLMCSLECMLATLHNGLPPGTRSTLVPGASTIGLWPHLVGSGLYTWHVGLKGIA
eukprot:scaffold3159_cov393-Prasinococcus_capsulatus_cf.AAC.8